MFPELVSLKMRQTGTRSGPHSGCPVRLVTRIGDTDRSPRAASPPKVSAPSY